MTPLVFLKGLASPGSVGFLLTCLTIGVVAAFVWPKRRRLAVAWIACIGLLYVLLSLPVVALTIDRRLPLTPDVRAADLASIDMLVVFDGDNRVGRVRQTASVCRVASPRTVWVLGAAWMMTRLSATGVVPPDRVRQLAGSENTRDQIDDLRQLVREHDGARIAVIASRLQAPRVEGLIEAAGLHVLLVPSPVDAEPAASGFRRYVPTYIALRLSRDALYEHAALIYYRWRGWIGPD